jgi:adenylate cyclase
MTTRRLAAILAADVVGFSKLIGEDEAGTLAALREIRKEIVNPVLAEHGGRVFKLMGDGMLAEFPSAVQALRAAMSIQERLRQRNAEAPPGRRIEVRIGVHQGDVVVEGSDLLGDGVNIAARLEGLAEPGGICVSGRVHEDAAGKIALDAKDMGEQNLKNIARPVRAYRVSTSSGEIKKEGDGPALPLPDKPSLAVLPFQNMSGDPEQEYFADGLSEDIITALSRMHSLFVIARNSTFTYKGRSVDVKQVSRELGARYILEGSVRKVGNRIRITGQLIDGETGRHIWADRYDRELVDIFDIQDEITRAVAASVQTQVVLFEGEVVSRERMDVWSLLKRAWSRIYTLNFASLEEASPHFSYSPPHPR